MKSVRIIAVTSVLFGLLYGCGAGGGGGSGGAIGARTATVTVQLRWPAAASKATTRAVPLDYTYATFEAFVGTQRIAFAQMTNTATNVSMTLPLSAVTFYVNVYASNTGINLGPTGITNPGTGVYSPVVPANPVLAHAVSTIQVAVGSPIVFTLNNTIASIVATSAASTTFALGSTPTLLENTVTAKDANGDTVLVSPRELIWQYAPTDTYASLRGLITPTPPVTPPTPPIPPTDPGYTLTPLATGTVSLLVSDIQVNTNTNQVPIQSIVKYTITLPATPITLQLDPSSTTGTLLAQCPLYAGSVKLKLTEQALMPDPNDVPAPPISVTQAVTFVPATYTVTIPTVSLSYSFSGRPFVLTIDAYSGTNGSGALLAETTSSTIPGSEFLGSVANPLKFASGIYTYVPTLDTSVRKPNNFFLAADYKINGIAVTPSASSIYYLNSGQTAAGLPTTVALQAALTGTGIPSSQPVVIDPRTVLWSSSKAAATVSNSTGAAPTAGAVTSAPVGAATAVKITASDRRSPAASGGAVAAGTASVTVNPTTGSGGLNIN